MVPNDPKQIPRAACRAIDRLVRKIDRDRESLVRSGQGPTSEAMFLLNRLADEADKLKKALQSPEQPRPEQANE